MFDLTYTFATEAKKLKKNGKIFGLKPATSIMIWFIMILL